MDSTERLPASLGGLKSVHRLHFTNAKICIMPSSLFLSIEQAATAAGFDCGGVAPASAPEMRELDCFAAWVDAGYAGEMEYLKRRSESGKYKRSALEEALPWAKSVIVVAMNYNPAAPKSTEPASRTQGWISRYALSPRDYHQTVLAALQKVEGTLIEDRRNAGEEITTRAYVDTGPVLERVYAKYAGIGWIGKNTCIINQELGSWIFLGVIVTSIPYAEFVPDQRLEIAPDRCGSCTRCIDACPTDALIGPHQLDASRCIAYFTIEKRGSIPESIRGQMGRHVFGCDICQDVCPWNRKAPVATNAGFEADGSLINPDLSELAQMSPEQFRQRFRGSPISRAKYSGFLRNVALAMGNSGLRDYVPELERLARSEDPVIAEHAAWALARLLAVHSESQQEEAVPVQ
jgi:epoxyqueuosine reductase